MERRDVAAVSRRSLVVGRGGGSRPFLFNAETIGIRPEPKSESPKDHLGLKCTGRCLPNNLNDSSPSGLVKRTEMFSSDRGGRGSRTLMGDDTPDLYADVTFTQILGGPAVGHDPHAGREYIDPSLDSVLRGKTESALRMTSCGDDIGGVGR